MPAALLSVAFDFSLDDLADVSVRYAYGTGVRRQERRRWIWKRALWTAAGAMVVFVALGRTRDANSLLGMVFTALVLGGASFGHHAYYYDAKFKELILR